MREFVAQTAAWYHDLQRAWEAHPDYTPSEYPACVAVFTHPPGRGGYTESYIVGDLQGVISQIEWGEKKLGDLAGIVPIWPGMPVNSYFVTVLSLSLKSKAAQAMAARDELKAILPKRLHRYVSLARRMNSRPKYHFLISDGTKRPDEQPQPEWYRGKTKGQLFVEHTLDAQARADIGQYVDPLVFWECATGRVSYQEVAALVNHQLTLPV